MTERARDEAALGALMRIDGLNGPAQRVDDSELDARAEALVDLWMKRSRVPVAPRRQRRWLWLAAAFVAVTGSAAAMWSGRLVSSSAPSSAPATTVTVAAPVAARSAPVRAPSRQPPAPPQAPAPARAAPAAAIVKDTRATEDLLRRANQLRGSGRYRPAERLYLRVLREAPNGASAQIAAVAAAALRLEHLHDPRGALALYRRARAAGPDAPLALETEQGIARAYARLGQRERERETLERIAASTAEGPVVDHARARLRALDAHVE